MLMRLKRWPDRRLALNKRGVHDLTGSVRSATIGIIKYDTFLGPAPPERPDCLFRDPRLGSSVDTPLLTPMNAKFRKMR
jgi:hypothetical protein